MIYIDYNPTRQSVAWQSYLVAVIRGIFLVWNAQKELFLQKV